MPMRRPLIAAASLALLTLASPAFAQGTAKAPAKPIPTKAQLEDAAYEMRVIISAMGSEKVEGPVKDALFQCLYQNSFATISDAVAKIVAQNPDKIAKRNPDQILSVLAGVCGYRPAPPPAGTAAPGTPPKPAPQPAKPGATPQGR